MAALKVPWCEITHLREDDVRLLLLDVEAELPQRAAELLRPSEFSMANCYPVTVSNSKIWP
jgi:hypothetical protein